MRTTLLPTLLLVAGCLTSSEDYQELLERSMDRDGDGHRAQEHGGDDCDDLRADVYPGGLAICGDEADNDCDGEVDEGESTLWFLDGDGDGYGDATQREVGCSAPETYVSDDRDCDDNDPLQHPQTEWFLDADGDGYGRDTIVDGQYSVQCEQPDGFVLNREDCNDAEATIYPGAPTVCDDDIVNDCDGSEEEEDEICFTGVRASPGGAALTLLGPGIDAGLGLSMDVTEDIDGDGWPDVLIGAPLWDEGSVYLLSLDQTGQHVVEDIVQPAIPDLSRDHWGGVVRFVGNVAGSSPGDFVVAADEAGSDNGEVWTHLYRDRGGEFSGEVSDNGTIAISQRESSAGYVSVAGVGNYNNSDYDDLVVGIAKHSRVYLMWGKVASTYYGSEESVDVVISGRRPDDHFGRSVASLGDTNGDGRDDLAVGAPLGEDGAGVCYVFTDVQADTLAAWDAETAFLGNQYASDFGALVASAGDVSGDGYTDLVVSAPYDEAADGGLGGKVYLFEGPFGGEHSADFADLTVQAVSSGDVLGSAVDGGRDATGDGLPDILVGSWAADDEGYDRGSAMLFAGTERGVVTWRDAELVLVGEDDHDYLGQSVSLVPDLDEDLRAEILIGAPGVDATGLASGAVFMFNSGSTFP